MSGWTVAMAGTAAAAFLAAFGTFGFGSASADGNPTPVAEVYAEGTLVEGFEGSGCVLLQNMLLLGDLGGFGVGDDVRVWGNVFVGITACQQGVPLEVKKIAALGPVGGVAELPQVEGALLKADGSLDGSAGILAGIANHCGSGRSCPWRGGVVRPAAPSNVIPDPASAVQQDGQHAGHGPEESPAHDTRCP